jgi:hypothetical protein
MRLFHRLGGLRTNWEGRCFDIRVEGMTPNTAVDGGTRYRRGRPHRDAQR